MTETKKDTEIQLQQIVTSVENIDVKIKALNEEKSFDFKQAKSIGFDTKALKQIIALRKLETEQRIELEGLVEVYKDALGMLNKK